MIAKVYFNDKKIMMDDYTPKKQYESFLRHAFGLHKGSGKCIERRGDPAELADADYFTPDNLDIVKAATAYAMKAYISNSRGLLSGFRQSLLDYIPKVICSSTIDEISDLINDFNNVFVKKYYLIKDEDISFK
jgi:hypothetical protein